MHTYIYTYTLTHRERQFLRLPFAVRCFPRDIFLWEQRGNTLLDIYLQNIKYNQIERILRQL